MTATSPIQPLIDQRIQEVPTFRALFSSSSRNWPEDFAHENGNYSNQCVGCEHTFIGHKRRITCKVCAAEEEAEAKKRADWLIAHDAPKDWVIISSSESTVSV